MAAATRRGSARPAVSLLIAVTGYGLTLWAWSLAGPFGLVAQLWSGHRGGALVAVFAAIVVGSLGRIPAGMLTDRYGARVVLPAISLFAAAAVLLLAAAGPRLPALAVAIPLGVGGATFAAGAAVVIRAYPPGRRGLWLSVFGAGMGVASAAKIASRLGSPVEPAGTLPLLALALVGYAVLAAALLDDPPGPRAGGMRAVLELLRLPATRCLSAWYAVAYGGLVASGMFLPAYLQRARDLPAEPAVLVTAGCLVLAAACRPLGGWLCRRHDPIGLLRTAFAGAGAAVLALALHLALPAAIATLGALAACLGTASGIIQALIGDTTPRRRAGTIAGTVGALGGLAGVLPPLLLATTHGVSGSYGVGLTMLAGVVTVTAWQLHRRRGVLGAAIAFPDAPAAPPAGVTVVVLVAGPPDARDGLAPTIAMLAGLASRRELVVVVPARAPWSGPALVAGLRLHLPRHRVVGITGDAVPHPHEAALVAELLEDGALPVVQPTTADADGFAAGLAAALGTADVRRLTARQTAEN
jgi:NNP family nitrate/nitrite transporter-like MFS transporter